MIAKWHYNPAVITLVMICPNNKFYLCAVHIFTRNSDDALYITYKNNLICVNTHIYSVFWVWNTCEVLLDHTISVPGSSVIQCWLTFIMLHRGIKFLGAAITNMTPTIWHHYCVCTTTWMTTLRKDNYSKRHFKLSMKWIVEQSGWGQACQL